MLKILIILFIGLVFESTGIVLLKKGMTHVGEVKMTGAAEIFRVVKAGAASPQILAGVFFEALFFVCLLIMMARSDISFIWPLTGLSFVFSTCAAIWFLNENVTPVPLGRRDAHCHRLGHHRLQRTNEGKFRAASPSIRRRWKMNFRLALTVILTNSFSF